MACCQLSPRGVGLVSAISVRNRTLRGPGIGNASNSVGSTACLRKSGIDHVRPTEVLAPEAVTLILKVVAAAAAEEVEAVVARVDRLVDDVLTA